MSPGMARAITYLPRNVTELGHDPKRSPESVRITEWLALAQRLATG